MTAKRNILIALMLLLIVAASACALVACNNTDSTEIGAQIATDNNGDPLYGGASYVMPEGMAFSAAASTAAETNTSVTLTANYTPSGTTNKQTNWSVYFKNPSSSWANGKAVTDYVTVQSTGTNTAKVTCLDSFGEQIIIKATSAADSSVYATTTVDFEKKVEDIRFDLYYSGNLRATAFDSQFVSGDYNKDYFESYMVDTSGSAIPISPYRNITVKIDYSTADRDYDLRVTPIFSDYTIDKSFGTFSEHTSSSTMQGETYTSISGSENGLSGRFIASDYFSMGYGFPDVIDDAIDNLYMYYEKQDIYTSLNDLEKLLVIAAMQQSSRYLEDWIAANPNAEVEDKLLAASLLYQFQEFDAVYEAGDGDMDYVFENYKVDAGIFDGFEKVLTYMGKAVDMKGAASAEEYFSENRAVGYSKVRYRGYIYSIGFRFNPDSL